MRELAIRIKDISIHALREEGDRPDGRANRKSCISIHALREEGDVHRRHKGLQFKNFYPRPPRGGRLLDQFFDDINIRNFYPRPPRGGRPRPSLRWRRAVHISIHALREEGDSADHFQ